MTKCEIRFLEKYILPAARMNKLNFKSREISVVQDIRFSYPIVVKFKKRLGSWKISYAISRDLGLNTLFGRISYIAQDSNIERAAPYTSKYTPWNMLIFGTSLWKVIPGIWINFQICK